MKEILEEKENLKIKRSLKKQKLRERGITLIALVVTIIILLILAGVTLSMALSQNGLFSRAQNAADKYKKAQDDEVGMLDELNKQFENITGSYTPENPPTDATTGPNGKPLPKTVTDTNHEGNVEAEDSLGNPVEIPGKFKIADDSGETVEDGIVIEDDEGNQFVWIPVSNINGDNDEKTQGDEQKEEDLIKLEDGKTVEITLRKVYV